MKKCSRCKKEKNKIEFGNNKRSKDGLWCYCKSCVSEMGKIERDSNPEKFKEKSKKYREKNKEKMSLLFKENYKKNIEVKKERQRKYYWKNNEEIKIKANERSKTPEYKKNRSEYYKKNKEWIKKQHEAHLYVQYAIKLGVLKKSSLCEECGMTSNLIDGHHKNYDKPLEVLWVCRKCHRKLEKQGN